MSLLLCQASCWEPHARNTKVGQLDEASCVCACVCLCARAPLGAGLCARGQLLSSAACLPAPDCSSLQNRRPPGFQLWKRSRRNSSIETPSSGASNSLCPGERGSVKGSRSPPGRGALQGREVLAFALLRPPRGRPRAAPGAPRRGLGVKVGGGRCFPPPQQPCSRRHPGRARRPHFALLPPCPARRPASQFPGPRECERRERTQLPSTSLAEKQRPRRPEVREAASMPPLEPPRGPCPGRPPSSARQGGAGRWVKGSGLLAPFQRS